MIPYKNPNLDIEQRLDDLISRMTLEELIWQTDQYASTSVDPGPSDDPSRVFSVEKMEEVFHGCSAGSVGAVVTLKCLFLKEWAFFLCYSFFCLPSCLLSPLFRSVLVILKLA